MRNKRLKNIFQISKKLKKQLQNYFQKILMLVIDTKSEIIENIT